MSSVDIEALGERVRVCTKRNLSAILLIIKKRILNFLKEKKALIKI